MADWQAVLIWMVWAGTHLIEQGSIVGAAV